MNGLVMVGKPHSILVFLNLDVLSVQTANEGFGALEVVRASDVAVEYVA